MLGHDERLDPKRDLRPTFECIKQGFRDEQSPPGGITMPIRCTAAVNQFLLPF